MRLTPFAKFFVTVVILAVVGYAVYHYKGADVRKWATGDKRAKSIIMQDWSRGGDGIVSLASINSIEQLKGHKVACTQFTPSHFLLLYLLAQSGLSSEDRTGVEKNIIFTQDAPAAAAMFKAKQVDAAVTWEPDLSAAVTARGSEAHVLVSTTAATNIIAEIGRAS